jgi:serine/threonine protein kinase
MSMAQIIPIGQPSNDPERRALVYLREHLPEPYRVLHNFELRHDDGQWFEVDVAIIAPHAVYIVDVKSTHGEIHVAGGKWHPERRAPFTSPLAKLRLHAKQLSTLIAGQPPRSELRAIWVEAAVILTAPDVQLLDPERRDRDHVVKLIGCEKFFQNASRLPHQPPASTAPHIGAIIAAIKGKARPQAGLSLYGRSWQCEERLGGNDFYTEYRARNAHVATSARVLVRVYRADPYLPADEREGQRERIANAYSALNKLPPHPAIPAARDFFPTENNDGYVLVLDDAPGRSLRVHLSKANLALTTDQKICVVADVLGALAHCHAHAVIHRALSPATIVVGPDGRSRLTDFDFARPGDPRSQTIAEELLTSLDLAYIAPEIYGDAGRSSAASDVYAAGVTFFELFAGERPFEGMTQAMDTGCVFARPVSAVVPGLPAAFDAWLQSLCAFDAAERPPAAAALEKFQALFAPPPPPETSATPESEPEPAAPELDYKNLGPGIVLGKYIVERPLGKPGGFGTVYRVVDTLGDVARALKIITADRSSTVERMKQEYRTLLRIPEHPNVVRVWDAGFLAGGQPYIVMECVDGPDLKALIDDRKLSVKDAHGLAMQAAEGLAHLHTNHVAHCDIKPSNLIWTRDAVKIIDFNVSVLTGDPFARAGGSTRYLPPDLDRSAPATEMDRLDRDVYALGITLYEALTGQYPWADANVPPPGQQGRDPRQLAGFEDLTQKLVEVMLKAIAPKRQDRFVSAREFAQALRSVTLLRQEIPARAEKITTQSWEALAPAGEIRPNTNPFVYYLLTLYSQSRVSNAGTRGLDAMARKIYVETALDRALAPATLSGEFRLVLISGNAGDGKTAFIQQVEEQARSSGAQVTPYGTGNGTVFKLEGRQFRTNYDGSQDEGEKVNDDVLRQFLAPFEGNNAAAWPDHETRLMAINEGRLIDFLEQFGSEFPLLKQIVNRGLRTSAPENGVAVVNLNLRSVVAESAEIPSILERLLRRLTEPKFWAPCLNCDLRDKCYVHHNARTFENPTAGVQVIDRLKLLYRLTTLRAKLHLTLRDLRSALAFMIAGTRNCDEIHDLYENGSRDEIVKGFYFNSWMGSIGDRLLRQLREVDVGRTSDPKLDRLFDFHPPDPASALMDFDQRGRYDRELLSRIHGDLPGDIVSRGNSTRFRQHREYVAMSRRRYFFECRDNSWQILVPYPSARRMVELIDTNANPQSAASEMIRAINRGEGVFDSRRLRGKLALQVRQVDSATVRSYRVFPAERFTLAKQEPAQASPYLEHSPTALLLSYEGEGGLKAELVINLDVFEMLDRLNQGYRPTVDEIQGYYLSLAVFKNILGSAPYQEVLLTPTGHDFYSVSRDEKGRLTMRFSEEALSYGA